MVKRHKSILSPEHARIGVRLGDARDAANLSQRRVAVLLGESQTWVSKIENGRRRVDAVELRRLVLLYKTDANSIVMPDYTPLPRPRVSTLPRAPLPRTTPYASPARPPLMADAPRRGRPRGGRTNFPKYVGPQADKPATPPKPRRKQR